MPALLLAIVLQALCPVIREKGGTVQPSRCHFQYLAAIDITCRPDGKVERNTQADKACFLLNCVADKARQRCEKAPFILDQLLSFVLVFLLLFGEARTRATT